jgi:uncharacterized protein (DUF2164 family)
MADKSPTDPMAAMHEAMAQFEQRLDSMSNTFFNTEQFAQGAGTATGLGAQMQKGMGDLMSRQLGMFNMPSRDDVTALGERMMQMDERLIRIEEMVSALAAQAAPAKTSGPPRTRKPPAKKSQKSSKK